VGAAFLALSLSGTFSVACLVAKVAFDHMSVRVRERNRLEWGKHAIDGTDPDQRAEILRALRWPAGNDDQPSGSSTE